MANQFIGEIRVVTYTFAPLGWADCDGRLLAIAEYDALFALIGTTYGGDGQNTFALPDLRGRVMAGQGTNFIGESWGQEHVTLTTAQIPAHSHQMQAHQGGAASSVPTQGMYADLVNATKSDKIYSSSSGALAAQGAIQPTGGSQPHENRMPFTTLRCIIALEGIFPSRN